MDDNDDYDTADRPKDRARTDVNLIDLVQCRPAGRFMFAQIRISVNGYGLLSVFV